MKYIQVQEIIKDMCFGCVHHDGNETGMYTEGCMSQRKGASPPTFCKTGIWIENTAEAHRNHELALVTQRLTQE